MFFKGNGIVWDAEKNKPLISFVDENVQEVKDERTIKKLKELGYESVRPNVEEKEVEEEKEVDPRIPSKWADIQKMAVEMGLVVKGKKKDELIEDIQTKLDEK